MYIRKLYPYILLACSFCFPLQASSSEKIEKAYFSTNNTIVDAQIAGLSYINDGGLDPRFEAIEVLTDFKDLSDDPFA